MSGVMSEALKVSEIHLHSPSLHNAQWETKRGQVDIHFRSQNKQFVGGFGLLRPNLHLETCILTYLPLSKAPLTIRNIREYLLSFS